MSLKDTREHIATTLTNALPKVSVHPYEANSPGKSFHGWVELNEVGQVTGDPSLGEVGLDVTVVIVLATDRATFERLFDELVLDLIAACEAAGGGSITVRPEAASVRNTTFYTLQASFYTESEAA